MMSESGMYRRALSWRAIAGAALVALTALVLSSVALAQERAGAPGILTAQQQYQYRYVPPSPQAVRVPELVGLSVAEAERLLREARLVLALPPTTATMPSGRIASQRPASGTAVAPGSRVSITLATPAPKPLAAPNLVGHSLAEAEAIVQRMGLGLSVRNQAQAGDGATVARQEPAPGSPVQPRSAIAVMVQQALATVPDVVGLPVARAQIAVREAYLQLALPPAATTDPAAIVSAQSPAAGTRVPARTAVTVRLAAPLAVVPDIVNQRLADARRLVAQARLTLALPENLRSASDDAVVAGQDPPAGRRVPLQSVVSARIALPPPPTRVPDLIGRSYGEAETLVRAARLRLGPPRRQSVEGGREEIVEQSPRAGIAVPPGLDVIVTIAVAPPRPPAGATAPPAVGGSAAGTPSLPAGAPPAAPPPPSVATVPIAGTATGAPVPARLPDPPPAPPAAQSPPPTPPPAPVAAAPASAPADVVPPAAPIWRPVALVVAALLLLALGAETAKRQWQRHHRPQPVRVALVRDTGRQRIVMTGPRPTAPLVSVRLRTSAPVTRLRRAA